jgi:hypothetical protein
MQDPDPMTEEALRRLLNRGLPEEDAYAADRVEIVLQRCREQVYGRDTVTLLFARLWVALANLLAQLLYLSRGRPGGGRIAAHFAASPRV